MREKSSRPSTWYEEERSRILYACEKNYDGNMIMLVMVMEEKLRKVQAERDQLMKDVSTSCECCVFINVNSSEEPCNTCMKQDYCHFKWRGLPDQKGSDRA